MSRQRRPHYRQQYYDQYTRPYYVKKSGKSRFLQFLISLIICVCFLTGASIRMAPISVFADVYPDKVELPPLVENKDKESDEWIKNLVPPIDNAIYMAWDYNPMSLEKIPPGVNVLAPTWFYIEKDSAGVAIAKNLLQMGKTNWNPQQYVELCHTHGVKVWGTVSSFVDPDLAAQIVTDSEVQQNVINQLVDWTRAYNLDGISIDFEKMDPKNKALFTEFARNLKAALPPDQNIVSVAVTVKLAKDNPNNWYQCYDRGGLAEAIDYVAVMTYEGHKGNYINPVAPINWVEPHIIRLLEEMPSNKLIMGVPFYGVDFISQVIDADSFDVNPLWKEDDDYRPNFYSSSLQEALVYGEYEKKGKTIKVSYWIDKGSWNDTLGASQYSFVDTNNMLHNIFIDDESSLYQKGALSTRYRLAGVGVWREGFGYDAMWESLADGLTP